jgi:hypothetical protein
MTERADTREIISLNHTKSLTHTKPIENRLSGTQASQRAKQRATGEIFE